jgi:hypothetical protein
MNKDLLQENGALVERVVAKSLLDAPEEAVQLLLDAERRGDLRYTFYQSPFYVLKHAMSLSAVAPSLAQSRQALHATA